jgi:hypothetical protein
MKNTLLRLSLLVIASWFVWSSSTNAQVPALQFSQREYYVRAGRSVTISFHFVFYQGADTIYSWAVPRQGPLKNGDRWDQRLPSPVHLLATDNYDFGVFTAGTNSSGEVIDLNIGYTSAYDDDTATLTVGPPPSGAVQVTLNPSGIQDAARWQVDGGDWHVSGATVNNLTVGNHTVAFSAVSGWDKPGDVVVQVLEDETNQLTATYFTPHTATAEVVVTNQFVVSARITDSGYGYTSPPTVYFIGGGGSGAQATANVNNGRVTGITIVSAGSGYTSTPIVTISPPYPSSVRLSEARLVSSSDLIPSQSYVLQVLHAGTWSDLGSSFVAPASAYSRFVDGGGDSSNYRFADVPVPRTALGEAHLSYGFVIGAVVTDGGSGYLSAPQVQIIGGGGRGATVTATVTNGVVSALSIVTAGSGYTNAPTIQIQPPPVTAWIPTVDQALRLDCHGLTAQLPYQVEVTTDFGRWSGLGQAFTPTTETNSVYLEVQSPSGFFRVKRLQ